MVTMSLDTVTLALSAGNGAGVWAAAVPPNANSNAMLAIMSRVMV